MIRFEGPDFTTVDNRLMSLHLVKYEFSDTALFGPDGKNQQPSEVLHKKHIVVIDTKGDHLIVEDAGRKLFHIDAVAPGPRVSIRLVTDGHWRVVNGQPAKEKGKTGFTVWSLKQGKLHATPCEDAAASALACLRS